MMWYGFPGEWFGLGGIGVMAVGFLGFVLLIIGIVYVLRWALGSRYYGHMVEGSRVRNDDALEILKARYASGEINKEEYESMKKDLGF